MTSRQIRTPSTASPPRESPSGIADGGFQQGFGNAWLQERLGLTVRTAMDLPHKKEMESAFGQDFSDLDVYHAPADQLASLGAKAFTWGNQVVLGSTDKHTVAHELAHVVQQTSGPKATSATSSPGDSAEQDADRAADAVLAGKTPEVASAATGHISGDWLTDAVGDLFDMRTDEDRRDAEEDLEDFMAQSYNAEHFHPSTRRGNFDANYDPSSGELTISVGVHFEFRDGSPSNPDWVANTAAGDPTFPASDFQWSDEEKAAFSTNALQAVEQHWSQQYSFHCTRQYWEDLPDVHVQIDIREATDAATSHYNIEVFKWPDGRVDEAHIDVPGTTTGHSHQVGDGTNPDHVGGVFNESALDGMGTLDTDSFQRTTATRAAYGAADSANPGTIFFDQNNDVVSPADHTQLTAFAQVMGGPAMPPFSVSVTGHSSSEGTERYNQSLSERRATSVSNILVQGGVKRTPTSLGLGESGATEDPTWRRVDITVGFFQADQTTVLHEFGHIFGLGDEYPTPDGGSRDVGQPVAHSTLAQNLGITNQPVLAHHSESIMSNGEVVQPWHYATFLEVLGSMTSTTGQWSVGPGRGPNPGMGDFPAPSGSTATA